MPPDVQLSELTAAGNQELNAQWTLAAESNLANAVRDHLKSIDASFVEYTPPSDDSPGADMVYQMENLYGTIADTILQYHFVREFRLPSKKGKFDWTLGPRVAALAQQSKADYALFVRARDSYSTPSRVALQVMTAVVTGYVMSGGQQSGVSSLIDLKTGEVVWFNALLPRDHGDLRDMKGASETTAKLLARMPK